MSPETRRVALPLLLSAPALVWTIDLLLGTPPLILAAATAPATLLAATILLLQRGGGRPARALAFALLWGAAGAAFLSSSGNELARTWIVAGEESRTTTALLVAPALEELAKALGVGLLLLASAASLRNARDGVVYGALAGIGFVWTENFLYLGVAMLQAGQEGLLRALYLRGILGSLAHAVFTACSAAGLGWWAARRGTRGAVACGLGGIVFAIALHSAWNAIAAPMVARVLCGAAAGGACADEPTGVALFGAATFIALLFLAPGILMAWAAWRSARETSS